MRRCMKVLWVCTSPMGPASRILGIDHTGSSGGWIQSEYEQLMQSKHDSVEMFFLCASRSVKEKDIICKKSEEGIAYCVNLPKISFGKEPPKLLLDNIKKVIEEVKPDIMHIWGTESCISYGAVKAGSEIKKVLFLQGVIGVHQRYKGGYLFNLDEDKDYIASCSIKKKFISYLRKHYFKEQISYEQYIIRNCQGVIIDNDFSLAYCKTVSAKQRYFYKYLTPNPAFYSDLWDYDSCSQNTIFTVFGQSAEKGMHQLLKAINIVKTEIPDVKLYVPGPFNCSNGKLKSDKYLTFYELWLANYIKKNNLEDNVIFLGKLSSSQMLTNLKKCNVFVNPSCMEVHALSLREAMAVGLPCITSLCGSVIEYVEHNRNGLIYRYEEFEVLANLIFKVLKNPHLATTISAEARRNILNKQQVKSTNMIDIYINILESSDF